MLADRDLSLLVTESLLLASAEGSDWAFIVSPVQISVAIFTGIIAALFCCLYHTDLLFG